MYSLAAANTVEAHVIPGYCLQRIASYHFRTCIRHGRVGQPCRTNTKGRNGAVPDAGVSDRARTWVAARTPSSFRPCPSAIILDTLRRRCVLFSSNPRSIIVQARKDSGFPANKAALRSGIAWGRCTYGRRMPVHELSDKWKHLRRPAWTPGLTWSIDVIARPTQRPDIAKNLDSHRRNRELRYMAIAFGLNE